MIRIKCGTCGTSQGYKTAADGKLTLPREEETRLVSRGVADYVTRPILSTAPAPETPTGGTLDGGTGVTLPESENAAPGAKTAERGERPATDAVAFRDELEIVDGHITRDSLLRLSRSDMEALAADLDINVGKCKNKSEIADLLSAVEIEPGEPDDTAALPDLGAEGPVV